MKPVILFILISGFFFHPSLGQVSNGPNGGYTFSSSEIQEIFSHSSADQSGIALIQPGLNNSSATSPLLNSELLTSFNPAVVLAFESLTPVANDSTYRSSSESNIEKNEPITKFAYEVIPRSTKSLLEMNPKEEDQETANYISDFTVNNFHIFTIGIGEKKWELSQRTLDYLKDAREQHSQVQHVLLFLSFPPEVEGELKGLSELEMLLSEGSFSIFLPYSAISLPQSKFTSSYHFLNKAIDEDQLYWISLADTNPSFSLIEEASEQVTPSECFNLLSEFGTQLPIQTLSLWNRDAAKPNGYVEIKVKNPTSYPMRLDADFLSHPHILPSIGAIESVIYPGSDKTLRVKLRTISELATSEPPLVEWSWKLTCMLSQQTETSLSGVIPISLSSAYFPSIFSQIWSFRESHPIVFKKSLDNAHIHYTLDGSEPSLQSPLAPDTLLIKESGTLKTKIFHPNGGHSQTESCVFIRSNGSRGLWKDIYPVHASFSLGEVSTLLDARYPAERRFVTSPKEIALAPSVTKSHFVQVLTGSLVLVDSSTIVSVDFNRMPRVVVRLNGEELHPYNGVPMEFTVGPGKHEWEIISLEKGSPRELQPNFSISGSPISLSSFQLD